MNSGFLESSMDHVYPGISERQLEDTCMELALSRIIVGRNIYDSQWFIPCRVVNDEITVEISKGTACVIVRLT